MAGALRWGILGTGAIAHLQTADLMGDGFTVAAVGSRRRQSAQAFADQFGISTAHGSYEALVSDPQVDAIYVATPHPFHAANAQLALSAGKHVLVEKPFTLNAAQARAVVELAARKHLVVLEAMWTRFLPHMLRIREIIAAGTLGEVRTVIADHNQLLSGDPTNRLNAPGLGGGALLDLGIYPVSLAVDLFGVPNSIHAIAAKTATGVDRQTAMLFGYPDGRQAVLHTALDTLGPNTAAIIGTAGRIEIDPVWYTATGFTVYDGRGTPIERFTSEITGRGMQYQAEELERLALLGESAGTILPPQQSLRIMEVLDEIRHQIGLRYPGE
ncbi:Gfo/Idh/MocA family oxidoreductase [Parafrigoribacterium mesophilum]|uniref:Gfo/Idh/MocA family protein n=1 Tax=Parafrigoribacterium mesophilum TaxID=433646 RepID=UPI0031FBC845